MYSFWLQNFVIWALYFAFFGVLLLLISQPAEVWLGEYQGSKVAIKMLKDFKDEKSSQRFLAEASIMT